MKIRFWGTRGSVPSPGPNTARFGGNTSCVEVRADDGTIVVIDCGTGARDLGSRLVAEGGTELGIHLLISHTHWDHIHGFPFFEPAYVPGCSVDIYAPPGLEDSLEASLSGQMQYTYFPVRLRDLRATLTLHELGEGEFQVGGVNVRTQYLNHTAPALGYRLCVGGATVVYASDHEPFWRPNPDPQEAWTATHPGDARHVAFLRGADVVIHDAQYVDREYPTKRGWGHSTVEYVADVAAQAGVGQLVLFHHDPNRNDQEVAFLTRLASRRAAARGTTIEVIAAAEGLELSLDEHAMADALTLRPSAERIDVGVGGGRLLVVGADAADVDSLQDALVPDGHELVQVAAESDLAAAVAELHPNLVLLVASRGLPDPLRTAGELRARRVGGRLPILAIVGEIDPARGGELLAEATDVVARPWSPPMLRSRVRAWLARTGPIGSAGTPPVITAESVPLAKRPRLPDLFRGLPARERAALLEKAASCQFAAGEVLFREGEPTGGVYYLREGLVQVTTRAPDGRDVVLALLEAGDTVGELSALDEGLRTATATAVAPTVAHFVSRDVFLAGLSVSPKACMRLLRLLAGRLRATDRRLTALAFGDLPSRVARQLMKLSLNPAESAAVDVDVLAQSIGVEQDRLERAIMLLEAGGIVRTTDGQITVTDRDGLLSFVFE